MLLLPGPWGHKCHGDAVHVSLRMPWHRRWQYPEVVQVARDFGCPPFILDRVGDAIRASGRYDCLCTTSVNPDRLAWAMLRLGGELVAHKWRLVCIDVAKKGEDHNWVYVHEAVPIRLNPEPITMDDWMRIPKEVRLSRAYGGRLPAYLIQPEGESL